MLVIDLLNDFSFAPKPLIKLRLDKMLLMIFSFLMDSMSLAQADQLFTDGFQYDAQDILGTLAEWDDPAVEPVMLEVVRRGVIDDMAADIEFQDAMDWLIFRKNQVVIGLVWDDLDHDSVFSALEETKYEPYLRAIREKLPDLDDVKRKNGNLSRQRSARANAISVLMQREKFNTYSELHYDNKSNH